MKKRALTLNGDTGIFIENMNTAFPAGEVSGESMAAGVPDAEQTENEFPSSGGVSAKQTGWLSKNKAAFTLAEVLISLTIIGVIAAITVPALIQKTNKQEYVTALQKAHSELSQASNMIIAENGLPGGEGGWASSADKIFEMYKKYLLNVKECGYGTKGCFNQFSSYRTIDGRAVTFGDWNKALYSRNLILQDGMQLAFQFWSASCSHNEGGSINNCGAITVDVNGEKKPNQYGRDVFKFVIKADGLYPSGCDIDNCNNNRFGFGCACKVLREGAMNY